MTAPHSAAALSRTRDHGQAASSTTSVPAPRARWLTRALLPGLILLAAAALLLYTLRDALVRAIPVQVVPVIVKSATAVQPATGEPGSASTPAPRAGGPVVAQAPGWVEAAPYAINVPGLADGVVREILVLEGEHVEAGQVVARLIDDDARLSHQMAQAELQEREAALAVAEAELVASQLEWDNPIERTRAVAAAAAMLAEAEAMLAQLPAEIAEKQAMSLETADELQRKSKLLEVKGVSEAELTRLRLRVDALQASVQAARQREGALRAQVDQARAESQAARDDLRLRISEKASLERAKAMVAERRAALARATAAEAEAALRLARMEVRAPVGGTVLERIAEPGSRLMSGGLEPGAGNVVRLFDPQSLQIRSDVAISDGAKIGVGQRAQIIVEVLPDRTFTGTVTRVVGQANIQKNTIQVKVAIDDPAAVLRPEMLARVKFLGSPGGITAGSPGDASAPGGAVSASRVLAPRSLLLDATNDHAAAWVVDQATSTAVKREIVLGASDSPDWIEAAEGLRPGDLIIVPIDALRPGAKVRITGEAAIAGANP